ncbi:hypothetical protein [Tropicimonas sp. IMCC34043]|uniref:hypothetical protein n=1 Tax=Tropicimonas sp. IMCC34043 TaxID=2248760 RepID=UPI000E21E1DB|nr:hypothetical protein [Tropicimonas sp. IMCC34043]
MSGRARSGGLPEMLIEGPWPFVTRRSYVHRGRPLLWRARQSRKGLLPAERGHDAVAPAFWQARGYNWLTGLLFAIGSMLFMLGATVSVLPPHWAMTPSTFAINAIFFLGSLPFTTAGYMQHFQAANAPEFTVDPKDATRPGRVSFIGWHPKSPGWLSTFTQFVGTVAFNFNTFDALHPARGWEMQDLTIWVPGMIGSVLFLVSGYLAYIEAGHGYWSWKPRELDWWIVFINFLGCIFFLGGGILAYVPEGPEPGWMPYGANAGLWLGALGFLTGALLLMRESAQSAPARQAATG